MSYHYPSCDLYFAGSGNELYRLNLDQGRFLAPLQGNSPGFNVRAHGFYYSPLNFFHQVCGISAIHSLLAFGGENGSVEFFDPRTKKSVGQLSMTTALAKLPDW